MTTTSDTGDTGLRARMAQRIDQELIARSRKRLARQTPSDSIGSAAGARVGEDAIADRLSKDVQRIAAKALGIPAEQLDPEEPLANLGIDSIAITEVMVQLSRHFGISVAPTTFFEARHLEDLSQILLARYGVPIEDHYRKQAKVETDTQARAEVEDSRPAPEQAVLEPVIRIPTARAASSPSSSRPDAEEQWIRRHGAVFVDTRWSQDSIAGTDDSGRPMQASPEALTAPSFKAESGTGTRNRLEPGARITASPQQNAPIAILSMEGLFPQSPDLDAFEAHLSAGDDCIEEIPPERWDWRAVQGDPAKGPFTNVKYGGFIPNVDRFDAGFFNISPREAELMDPQHRLFMEVVWRLIEKAGYAPGSLAGQRVSLFLGINLLDYVEMANRAGIMDAQQLTGLGHAFCPNRLSFLLDIHGPSEVVDTACSSSLLAIHRGVMSIRHEGCNMAIAGGSNLLLSPMQHILFSKVGMITPDGRCKTFSKDANGYARADGVGAVLLKRLDLAERDGDPILGVIRGSVAHHGGGASSLTAPNPESQAQLIREAHHQAGVDPRTIGLIECHGTGTRLGDPIEVQGLKRAFDALFRDWDLEPSAAPAIGLGSVKSNIGHTETAAGVAGLIKVLLAMQHQVRYRTLHCTEPNPLLELKGSPFYLLQQADHWPRPLIDGHEHPRRAGLSSFGAGGANVHLVIEEYQTPETPGLSAVRGPVVVPVSAKSEQALVAAISQLRAAAPCQRLADLAYTLQIGRDAMRWRAAFVVSDLDELLQRMDAFLAGDNSAALLSTKPTGRRTQAKLQAPNPADAEVMARHWVSGGGLDWRMHQQHALDPAVQPRRIGLPGYAFQGQRYWLPAVEPITGVSRANLAPDVDDAGRYRVSLTGKESFLDDHRLSGVPVLPGVAYLELARELAAAEGIAHPRLQRVVWMAPLEVVRPVELLCTISHQAAPAGAGAGAGVRADIFSQTDHGERLLHAQMQLVADMAPILRPADLDRLREAPGRHLSGADVYARLDAMGLNYGPSHRVIEDLWIVPIEEGDPNVLARLSLSKSLRSGLDDFGLHPGLLDGALQSAMGLAMDAAGETPELAGLPFSVDQVQILGRCEAQMWVWVRKNAVSGSNVRKLDIDLMADDGDVRVSLQGFTTRTPERSRAAELLRFEPVWRRLAPPQVLAESSRRIVLLATGTDLDEDLRGLHPSWEVRILPENRALSLDQRYLRLAGELLRVAQRERSAGPVTLQLVLDQDPFSAPLEGLGALLRSIAREHPALVGQLLFVTEDMGAERLAVLLQQAKVAPAGACLKVQDEQLVLACWQEVLAEGPVSSRPASALMPWRAGGVYLLTGGSGLLGQGLAREILEKMPEAIVVLASRRAPTDEVADWIASLPNLHHRQADLADETSVAELVEGIRRDQGRLDGVIHAAGIVRDAPFETKTSEQLLAVLGPKVTGAVALDKAIGDAPLDFFLLYSSISGVVGNIGQADYAAANSFLDGFAEMREIRRRAGQCHGRTLSIAWPLWREGGLSIGSAQQALMRRVTGLVSMETRQGIDALYAALRGQSSRVCITVGDATRIRRFIAGAFEPAAQKAPSTSGPPTSGYSNDDSCTATSTAARSSVVRPSDQGIWGQADLDRRIRAVLVEAASKQLKVSEEDLDPDVELTEYGFDSIGFTQFANRLNDEFDLELTPTLFFDHPTIDALAQYLSEQEGASMAAALGVTIVDGDLSKDGGEGGREETPLPQTGKPSELNDRSEGQVRQVVPVPLPESTLSFSTIKKPATPSIQTEDPIAVVGMSGQFPGAPDLDAFWELLETGTDCIGEVPAERWDWRDHWGDPLTEPGKCRVKWGGFIQDIDAFDAAFFGITAPEARMMDPQQRLLLTQSWRVMEDAGYAPSALAGSSTGVFIGTADTGYSRLIADADVPVEGYAMTGLAPSLGPNRISYFYDFHGPSVAVETACSSALIAIHRAVEAIRSGQCTAAIAGGINLLLLPETFVGFSKAGMLSPDGRCKPFSDRADGYARGEGCGLVFLKPLADAERDGDRIWGLIRATAENHGGHAASLTAPNPRAQASLIKNAYDRSGLDPRTVGYIEAHGTGTSLGDPIEVEALTAAFADLTGDAERALGPAPRQDCVIGSVKSNIGHLELAAGAAGLIKVLLQMRHGKIVKSLHSETLNPYLKLTGSPFRVAQQGEDWEPVLDAAGRALPRRAGVSSFGFGGANAHLVLEEYPVGAPSPVSDLQSDAELMVLSARSETQLREMAGQLLAFLSKPDRTEALADIALTLQCARQPMEFRLGFSVRSRAELLEALRAYLSGEATGRLHTGRVKSNRKLNAVLEDDAQLSEAIIGLAARGRGEDLLALWAGGLNVDWVRVREDRPGRRITLPGYPFAKTRYWIETNRNETPDQGRADRADLSLLVDGSESYLRDHLINGVKVLPGVFSLELLHRAVRETKTGAGAFELLGHTWTDRVSVDRNPRRLQVSLAEESPGGAPYSIIVHDDRGTTPHAQGVLRFLDAVSVPPIDLDALKASLDTDIDVAALYRRFEVMGLSYGPAQRAIRRLQKGPDFVLARLEVPDEADRVFTLHPALLDGALQAVFALNASLADGGIPAGVTTADAARENNPTPLALPFSVRRIAVLGATSKHMWAVLRPDVTGSSIDLCDDQGHLIVRMEDFVVRDLEAPAESSELGVARRPNFDEGKRRRRSLDLITEIAARVLEVDRSSLDVDTDLGDFGFDSLSMTAFASRMNAELGLSLTPADFFEYATLNRLASHVSGDLSDERLGLGKNTEPQPLKGQVPEKTSSILKQPVKRRSETAPPNPNFRSTLDRDPIVIVGQSCRFPMAVDADAFWDNLVAQRDCISRIPSDRWSWQELDGDPRQDPSKTNIHWGGFIDGVFDFDPLFFGISPREARLMDPQQRLMLTHAWKAIEDAGHSPRGLAGQTVGVFVGTASSGYQGLLDTTAGAEGHVATGSVASVGPNRISYLLDLHGPSEPVETACSSSLVALHRAVQAIEAGDCDMALVGGVNTILTPDAHINFALAGMLSPDGRCKTFSAQADGYGRGEGVGMLFLRRLSDAERDGDPILAVVRGTAVNHGGHANSLTAPNTRAQAELLRTAYHKAGIDPRTIGYVEAHGTGTPLGDPVEINALTSAFRSLVEEASVVEAPGSGKTAPWETACALGSVKTNIGHLELAAGVAGVIKVLKQMEHRQLVPSLHCDALNPYIDLSEGPFEILRKAKAWMPVQDANGEPLPLRAGISSFGFGGVNAHVILEEYRSSATVDISEPDPDRPLIAVLSARDRDRLKDSARNLLTALTQKPRLVENLADLVHTLQVGRAELAERLAMVLQSREELSELLSVFLADGSAPMLFSDRVETNSSISLPPGANTSAEEIAKHWVRGGQVDWRALNPGSRRRLRLPTYPFARIQYRADQPDIHEAGGEGVRSWGQSQTLRGSTVQLDADAFYLKDHRVNGNQILPGAMSIDILCQAALDGLFVGSLPLVISDLTWRRPIVLNNGQRMLEVEFSGTDRGDRPFRLLPFEDRQADVMRGRIRIGSAESAPPHLEIGALQQACPSVLDPDWLYARYAALGIDYGPSFRAITDIRSRDSSADGEALVRLCLPKAAQLGGDGFVLHPSLLDAAFQASLMVFSDDAEASLALPFGIDSMVVFKPTSPVMWAHLRARPAGKGIRQLDIDLADDSGQLSARILGFSLRLLPDRTQDALGQGLRRAPHEAPSLAKVNDRTDRTVALTRSATEVATATSSPTVSTTADETTVEDYFIGLVARETELSPAAISLTAPLEDYGIDSVLIMQLTERLERDFGTLPKTLFFEHQTLQSLIGYFRDRYGTRLGEIITGEQSGTAPIRAETPASKVASKTRTVDEPIAIIGLAGRYPGARTLEEFWENLAAGRDCITEVPLDRWDQDKLAQAADRAGKPVGRWGGFIEGHDRFDPMFFNIAPREAQLMDPQERLFLECAWETLEDAGYTRASVAAQGDVGVFVGVMWQEYQLHGAELQARGQPEALSGSAASIANRVSYFMNFHGPSLALDTMCSSSLTAIHLACDSLRGGSCSVALAGGVNLTPHPNKYIALSQGRFLSSNGRCQSFGEGGDGYVPAEGVGAVLLKPLHQAEADGDRIHGLILGSALNHGGKTNGYTVPNPTAQRRVIEKAMASAGVSPEEISYVEAHGTGTSLGDPIEIAALTGAYRSGSDQQGSDGVDAEDRPRCAIGSVKSNIGHAESAAGMAGLTKLLLQLKHGQIVPSLHAETLNPNIEFETSPFRVQRTLAPWLPRRGDVGPAPRIAALSSFGAGGSNAHFVVSDYPEVSRQTQTAVPALYPFSARDPERLRALVQRMRRALEALDDHDMPSVAFTLQQGREAFEERLLIVADNRAELIAALDAVLADPWGRGGDTLDPGTVGSRASRRIFWGQTQGSHPARRQNSRHSNERSAIAADIAADWVKGIQVDWAGLRRGPKPRPISLPGYPFAREHCWPPELSTRSSLPLGQWELPLMFTPVWGPGSPASGTVMPLRRRLHVLCDPRTLFPGLEAELKAGGAEVVVLNTHESSPDARYSYYVLRLFELLKQGIDRTRQSAQRKMQQAVPSAFAEASDASPELLIQVFLSYASGGHLLAGLSGLLRSAALEMPGLRCQLVVADGSLRDAAARLTEDAVSALDDVEIRYRDGARLVRSWRELTPADRPAESPWKTQAVYLLTGGAGGLGLHLAEAIAASGCQPRLWLTGRSRLGAEREMQLKRLETLGAKLRYRQVDVTDQAALSELLLEIERTDGALNGVFHGAGLTRDGLLSGKTEQTFRAVLEPKVRGVHVLDEAIGNRSLDFMVLFASAAGALGNPGQSDYAAANAYLDQFAGWRNQRVSSGMRQGWTVSIDWPYWRDGGMRMQAQQIESMARFTGVQPLETGPALAALEAILFQQEADQVLVLEGDQDRIRHLMASTDVAMQSPAKAAAQGSELLPVSVLVESTAAKEQVVAAIRAAFSSRLRIPEDRLDLDESIDRYGVDSVSALEILELLQTDFGALSQTLLFEFPTIGRLADALLERGIRGSAMAVEQAGSDSQAVVAEPSLVATRHTNSDSLETPSAHPGRSIESPQEEIAIIAVSGRFPGADTIEAFAELLREGRDCVSEIPEGRRALLPTFSACKGQPGASYCKWGAFLSEIEAFDAGFFGYTPRAADLADPQERLFLETAWHLFERAGHTRKHLAEHYDKRVGVFVGSMYNQYPGLASEPDAAALLALSSYSGIANRTSFFFDLQGPSVAVDSMCSSGLQAVHQACQSLLSGECRLAVAGGVNLSIHPAKYEALSRAGLVGSDPDARAFAGGDGYLPAEAVGAVLLKPLGDALADGNRVLGVIKGSLANHAGHSAGYAVPNVDAQVRLLEDVYRRADVDPASIGYIEAAATGSQIGDAIELRALARVFAGNQPPGQAVGSGQIALGSVKTNMGHAEAASGLAQLTKVLLQFEHEERFPSFMGGPAPKVLDDTPFRPQTTLETWSSAGPRRAAISSFGAGGSNVHLILEEPPTQDWSNADPNSAEPLAFPLSARSESRLMAMRQNLADHLRQTGDLSLSAISHTLSRGREVFEHRALFLASSIDELIRKLEQPGSEEDTNSWSALEPEEVDGWRSMLVLPGYPFERERHWLTQTNHLADCDQDATAMVSPPTDLTVGSGTDRKGDLMAAALQTIRDTLARELGVQSSTIDPETNFDSLGVDSMARMRLAYRIEQDFGLLLKQQNLNACATPARLAELVEATERDADSIEHAALPENHSGPYRLPLGESQKGLWVLQSLYPNSSEYNVPIAFRCQSVDQGALQRALDWLVEEHPILATGIRLEDEEPLLLALPHPIEIRSLSIPKEFDTQAFLRQRAAIPFDLSQGVFRVEHLSGGKLGSRESILLLIAHHLVTDGASSAVMTRDFWKAYVHCSKAAHRPETKAEQSADYSAFVAWEKAFMASALGQAQKGYWLSKLDGPLPVLQFPVSGVLERECLSSSETLELPATLVERLAAFSKANAVTPAAVYLSVFAALLYRYSGEDDLVIGVPTLRRPSGQFAETLGYCANMIALRLAIDSSLCGAALARRIHLELQQGIANSDYPFNAIVRELGGSFTGQVPYGVTFAYQAFGQALAGQQSFASGEVCHLADVRQSAGREFGIEVQETPDGALVIAHYDASRFPQDLIRPLLHHYRLLLDGFTTGDDASVSTLSMLTSSEARRALGDWSRTQLAEVSGTPIHEQVLRQAAQTPSAIAVAGEQMVYSYKALRRESARIAKVLARHGIDKGDRVAVFLGREAQGIAALLAVMRLGAVWVPLAPEDPDERLSFVLEDAGVMAVLTLKSHLQRLQALQSSPVPVIDLDRLGQGLRSRLVPVPSRRVSSRDPAYIIYTSGSTGMPKGVMVSHGALAEHCEVIAREYQLSDTDLVLQFAPASVDTAIEQMLPILTLGGRLVLRPEPLQTPEAFLRFLGDRGITVADLPPVYLHELLRAWEGREQELSALALRLMIVGGEALTPEVVARWHQSGLAGRRLVNAYGPTEATVTALIQDVEPDGGDVRIPIGRPLPGVEVYILDRDGHPVPDGVIGTLHLGGERLAMGYHERSELTAQKFRHHALGDRNIRLYDTGDLACFRPEAGGLIEFHGRRDDQVKLRGHRIELGEVEAAIEACGISEVAVLLEQNKVGDPVLTAYVVVEAQRLDVSALTRRLAERLPAHMVPSVWIARDRLEKTASGKIDRLALSRAVNPDEEKPPRARRPCDPIEGHLLAIWCEVLGLSLHGNSLGLEEDFSAVGGHSLLAVRLLSRIEQAFGQALSITDLSRARTIASQARLLRQRGVSVSWEGFNVGRTQKGPPSLLVSLRSWNEGAGQERVGQDTAGYDRLEHERRVNGTALPLFLIHPVAGTLSCYHPLIEALQLPVPLYGIRAAGLEPSEAVSNDSLEAMAARYCAEIRSVQPTGPYRLCGWSYGGVVAYEMARQLHQTGGVVSFLGLIDSYLPDDPERVASGSCSHTTQSGQDYKRAFLRDLFGIEDDPDANQDILTRLSGLPQFQAIFPGGDEETVERLFMVYSAHYQRLQHYTPRPSDVPITLIRAIEGAPREKPEVWERLTRKALDLYPVQADHFSVLEKPAMDQWLPIIADIMSTKSDDPNSEERAAFRDESKHEC